MKKKIDNVTTNSEYNFYRKYHKIVRCWYCMGACCGWDWNYRSTPNKNWKTYRKTQYRN